MHFFVDRVNHWIIMITFLQHTDPLLPHYRASEFTFPRGALATYDRSLLGDLGPVMAWLAATLTHGISETHVAHHVNSKIPHYHAWEATDALRVKLGEAGIKLQGRNSGWGEVYRVYKQCKVCTPSPFTIKVVRNHVPPTVRRSTCLFHLFTDANPCLFS